MRKHIGRPSPATVISCLALFVALGGTGYAATSIGRGTVGTTQIKNDSVKSEDIKNAGVSGKDIRNSTVGSPDLKKGAVTGNAVDEAKLSKVPSAATADRAASAGTAAIAGNGIKAYGTVNPDGSVVAAKSSNITVSKLSTGSYCVRAGGVSSATRTLVATADYRGVGDYHIAQYDSVADPCTDSGGWIVRTRLAGNAPQTLDLGFSVVIP